MELLSTASSIICLNLTTQEVKTIAASLAVEIELGVAHETYVFADGSYMEIRANAPYHISSGN